MAVVVINPQDTSSSSGTVEEQLIEQIKKWYTKTVTSLPGDWSFEMLPKPSYSTPVTLDETLAYIGGTKENIKSAYIYGNYPSSLTPCNCDKSSNCFYNLQGTDVYCATGLNASKRPVIDPKYSAYEWLTGNETALLTALLYVGDQDTGEWYWVRFPATLQYELYHDFKVITSSLSPRVERDENSAFDNLIMQYNVQYQYGYARRVSGDLKYTIKNEKGATVAIGTIPLFSDTINTPNPPGTNTKSGEVLIPTFALGTGTFTIEAELYVTGSRGIEDYTNPKDPLLAKETTLATSTTTKVVISTQYVNKTDYRKYLPYAAAGVIVLLIASRRK